MNYKDYIHKKSIDLSKKDPAFELGNLITEARLYAGISQAELAKRIGTQQPSIARAEAGELEPSIGFLRKIADAVNTTFIPPQFGFMAIREPADNVRVFAYCKADASRMDFSLKPRTSMHRLDFTPGYFTRNQSGSSTRQLQFAGSSK